MNIISATNKINFGYYEKLFRHFGFGNDHLLRGAISANIYSVNTKIDKVLISSKISAFLDFNKLNSVKGPLATS